MPSRERSMRQKTEICVVFWETFLAIHLHQFFIPWREVLRMVTRCNRASQYQLSFVTWKTFSLKLWQLSIRRQARGNLWLGVKNTEETIFVIFNFFNFNPEICKETIDWNSNALPEGVYLKNHKIDQGAPHCSVERGFWERWLIATERTRFEMRPLCFPIRRECPLLPVNRWNLAKACSEAPADWGTSQARSRKRKVTNITWRRWRCMTLWKNTYRTTNRRSLHGDYGRAQSLETNQSAEYVAGPSKVGVHFFSIFCNFEFSSDRHCHGTRKCPHRLSCYASLYRASWGSVYTRGCSRGASRMRRNYGDAAAHHSTHNTQDHTHTYIPTSHTEQCTTKTKHEQGAAWRRAATALCVASVSRLARCFKSGIITYQPKGSIDV